MTSPSCSTPAARPASPRARCSRTATWSRTCCRPRPGSSRSLLDRATQLRDHRAAAVPHLLADGELPAVHDARRPQRADRQPARLPGFVKELREAPLTFFTGVNTLFNALMNTPGFDRLDFSALSRLGGGMAVQRAVAERWKQVTGQHAHPGLGPDRDLAGGLHQPARRSRSSPARSACRSPSTEVTIRDDDGNDAAASAQSARSACAARR